MSLLRQLKNSIVESLYCSFLTFLPGKRRYYVPFYDNQLWTCCATSHPENMSTKTRFSIFDILPLKHLILTHLCWWRSFHFLPVHPYLSAYLHLRPNGSINSINTPWLSNYGVILQLCFISSSFPQLEICIHCKCINLGIVKKIIRLRCLGLINIQCVLNLK